MKKPPTRNECSADAADPVRAFVIERFATLATLAALMLAAEPVGVWLQAKAGSMSTVVMAVVGIGGLLGARLTGRWWVPALLNGRHVRLIAPLTWVGASVLATVFYAFSGRPLVLAAAAVAAIVAAATAWRRRGSLSMHGDQAQLPCSVASLLDRCNFDARRVRIAPDRLDEAASLVRPGGEAWIELSPDVVQSFSDRQLAVVIAHELGHAAQREGLASTLTALVELTAEAAAAAVVLAAAGAGREDMLYMIPSAVAAVALAETVQLPVAAWLSRRQERRANRFALRTTGDAEAFVSAMRKVHQRLGSPPEPRGLTKLLASHPSLGGVLAQARAFTGTTSSA